MPKLIHISDEAAHKLDVIRDRRDCSFTEAVMWLVGRSKELGELQRGGVKEYDPMQEEDRRKVEARKHDAAIEATRERA